MPPHSSLSRLRFRTSQFFFFPHPPSFPSSSSPLLRLPLPYVIRPRARRRKSPLWHQLLASHLPCQASSSRDLFNLAGCFLEPATDIDSSVFDLISNTSFLTKLPTQFYMALLYTITTLILTGQTIYYSHIYHHLKLKNSRAASKPQKHQHRDASLREKLLGAKGGAASINNESDTTVLSPSSPIPVNMKLVDQYHGSSSNADYYYMSARSLSRSPVPTAGIWSGSNRQSSRSPPQMNDQRGSLIGEIAPEHSAPSTVTKNALSVAPWMGLLLGTCLLHILIGNKHREMASGTVIPIGRRLLLFVDDHGNSSLSQSSRSEIGSFLGWAMAMIYMGGRLPQILLNVRLHKNKHLLFVISLIGNRFSVLQYWVTICRIYQMQRGHVEASTLTSTPTVRVRAIFLNISLSNIQLYLQSSVCNIFPPVTWLTIMIFNSIQGLNPLMFTFALLGNSTYVGSILVNSLDWSKLRPNLPWLVESGGCVLLDSCVSFTPLLL
ncbi:hypothetical protein Zm00014a_037913 [Zea mays]|uniref:PQ-loop repeat family protein / transmembrane family protein n=1 Tax=Zea mays TaxID=4577 RepID=A0A3L6DN07_MAIZE|nr:hypothetical protein Zm00014a_037913 [Zea mays]